MELRPGRAGALVDSPDGVLVTGAPPGAAGHDRGHPRAGRPDLVAARGSTSPTATARSTRPRTPSSGGSYRGVDPFGLFWSAEVAARLRLGRAAPDARHAAGDVRRADRRRRRTRATVAGRRRDRARRGRAGRGRPAVPARRCRAAPGVVLVGGPVGGPGGAGDGPAAGRARRRRAVARPLEPPRRCPTRCATSTSRSSARACDWLRAQDGVDDLPPCVVGSSRGGELALLAASLLPDRVGPVASLVGSGVPGGRVGPGTDVLEPAWSLRRRAGAPSWRGRGRPRRLLDDADMVAAAEIAVERATGPVLLLSGEDDAHVAERAAQRGSPRRAPSARGTATG